MREKAVRHGPLAQDVARGAECLQPAAPDKQHGRGKAQSLFHGVGDVENGDVPGPGDAGDIFHEFVPAGGVEGGQRFVHEQQARAAEQARPIATRCFSLQRGWRACAAAGG